MIAVIVVAAVCLAVMVLAAYRLGHRAGSRITPDPEDIRAYLDAQLAVEELDRAERDMRVKMLKADRTAVPNSRAGQPVRITSIHITG